MKRVKMSMKHYVKLNSWKKTSVYEISMKYFVA